MSRLNWFEKLFMLLLLFFDTSYVMAQKLPGDAAQLLPVLQTEIVTYWPDLQPQAFPALVIYQESRWKAKATLKTSRELGCGLGQFTIAYDASGKPRFDALTETKGLSKSLASWDWRDCYNTEMQMRAVVLKLKANDRSCKAYMTGNREIKACAAAAYNGGLGSVPKRARMCRMQKGCKPDVWFDNLDKQCAAATTVVKGYGESFCMINSKYPGRVESGQPLFRSIWPKEPMLSEWPKK